MHTVIETASYLRAAAHVGLSEAERMAIVTELARKPDAGEVIKNTGGCRKMRVAGRSKGKSGGYRVITFYSGLDFPVFLLTVFGKGEKADLTATERNDLAKLTKMLIESLSRTASHSRTRT